MSINIDSIADLQPGRTNWVIVAKVLNSWSIRTFLQKRVLLLVDEQGGTIEVAFLEGTLKKLRRDIENGEWYMIRDFKIINPTLDERNTHHPHQIKFTDESTMKLLQPLNQKNYFRFDDLEDIYRGRVTHPISFDVCGCIVRVEVKRRDENGRCSEVVFTLLNGRNESIKYRAIANYAYSFITCWEENGCHLLHKSEPIFCVLRFWKVGSYEGAPCLVHTEASSRVFIKPDINGLEHHQSISEFDARYHINHVMEQDGDNIETPNESIAQADESSGTQNDTIDDDGECSGTEE